MKGRTPARGSWLAPRPTVARSGPPKSLESDWLDHVRSQPPTHGRTHRPWSMEAANCGPPVSSSCCTNCSTCASEGAGTARSSSSSSSKDGAVTASPNGSASSSCLSALPLSTETYDKAIAPAPPSSARRTSVPSPPADGLRTVFFCFFITRSSATEQRSPDKRTLSTCRRLAHRLLLFLYNALPTHVWRQVLQRPLRQIPILVHVFTSSHLRRRAACCRGSGRAVDGRTAPSGGSVRREEQDDSHASECCHRHPVPVPVPAPWARGISTV